MQTGHWGKAKLTVTVTEHGEEGVPPLVIGVKVVKPTALGTEHNEYDALIAEVAHEFGIPPQYLKAQVGQESSFNPNAYKYEMRVWDAHGAATWGAEEWKDYDYYLYRFPRKQPSILSDDDVAPRNIFEIITEFNDGLVPPAWPYATRRLTLEDDPVLLWDLYEANEGWPCETYSWRQYNPTFPCGSLFERVGPTYFNSKQKNLWYGKKELDFMNFHRASGYEFWCGKTKEPIPCTGTAASEGRRLLDLKQKKWAAQTAIAASYGLLQLAYTTAVEACGWNRGQPGETRHPASLFDPKLNLELGGRYDGRCMRWALGAAAVTFEDKPSFENALARGFGYYNSGLGSENPNIEGYGRKIVEQAKAYLPR